MHVLVNKDKIVEKIIAEFYIIFLPFQMLVPFLWLTERMRGMALYFDFFISLIGLMLMMKKWPSSNLHNSLIFTIGCVELISLINAIRLYKVVGTTLGETTFTAISGQCIYWIQYYFIIVYSAHVIDLIGMKKICKLLKKVEAIMLVLGYIQMVALYIQSSVLGRVLDELAVIFQTYSFTEMIKESRITLLFSEPAFAGYYLGTLVFPFILFEIVENNDLHKNLVRLLLWLPVVISISSSNCYVILIIELIAAAFFYLKKNRLKINLYILISAIAAGTIIILLVMMGRMPNIGYYAFEKLFDKTNMSVAWRYIPYYVNWGCFKSSFLIGIGNGNQGFFYWEHFPQWADELLKLTETYALKKSEIGNGALFFPSCLAGYGIIGCSIIAFLCVECRKRMINTRYYYLYAILILGIVVRGMVSDFVGCYDVFLAVGMPFSKIIFDKKMVE